jgi:hypothetical protein
MLASLKGVDKFLCTCEKEVFSEHPGGPLGGDVTAKPMFSCHASPCQIRLYIAFARLEMAMFIQTHPNSFPNPPCRCSAGNLRFTYDVPVKLYRTEMLHWPATLCRWLAVPGQHKPD